tara:strand:+ start:3680 stop:3916 length:237 start_codon:yes stop_codon:yes gene_type:complete
MHKRIKVGDLVRIKKDSWPGPDPRDMVGDLLSENSAITGIVVGLTLGEQPEKEDYWIKVVFLDGTRSTLFHDEVNILK